MQNESYNVSEITDKKTWDDFVTSQSHHTFLHSWAWGEFNEAMGDKVWRIGIYDNRELVAVCLAIKVHAKRGNFLFVPHGPVFAESEKKIEFRLLISKQLTEKLRGIARHTKVSFIRVSPVLYDIEENRNLFKKLDFRPAPIHMHAETTWTLNLAPSEEELLMGMRKTTRNLVRRAIKEGVEITTGVSHKDVETFYSLYRETVAKHHFTPFSLTYIENQVKILSGDNNALVFTAWHNTKPLASAIIVFYGNSAFYHHGSSVPSKIPAAYLLQWEAILEAKRRGHKFYNFWGIVKDDAPKDHPWRGITLFKKGFGGFTTNYLHAQDFALSWKYWPNWAIETIRRRKRNL